MSEQMSESGKPTTTLAQRMEELGLKRPAPPAKDGGSGAFELRVQAVSRAPTPPFEALQWDYEDSGTGSESLQCLGSLPGCSLEEEDSREAELQELESKMAEQQAHLDKLRAAKAEAAKEKAKAEAAKEKAKAEEAARIKAKEKEEAQQLEKAKAEAAKEKAKAEEAAKQKAKEKEEAQQLAALRQIEAAEAADEPDVLEQDLDFGRAAHEIAGQNMARHMLKAQDALTKTLEGQTTALNAMAASMSQLPSEIVKNIGDLVMPRPGGAAASAGGGAAVAASGSRFLRETDVPGISGTAYRCVGCGRVFSQRGWCSHASRCARLR